MSYNPININRKELTLIDVPFPDIKTLESAAAAIGSNMFEGYNPTVKGIECIRDYCLGKLTIDQLAIFAKEKSYE